MNFDVYGMSIQSGFGGEDLNGGGMHGIEDDFYIYVHHMLFLMASFE